MGLVPHSPFIQRQLTAAMTASSPPSRLCRMERWFDELEAGSFDADLLERASAGRMTWTAGVAELLADR